MKKLYLDTNVWAFLATEHIAISNDIFNKNGFELNSDLSTHIEMNQPNVPKVEKALYDEIAPNTSNPVFEYVTDENSDLSPCGGGFATIDDPDAGGEYIDSDRLDLMNELETEYPSNTYRPTGFKKNEADIFLASKAAEADSYAITADIKNGPLKKAKENGHKVIFIDKLAKDYIKQNGFLAFILKEIP